MTGDDDRGRAGGWPSGEVPFGPYRMDYRIFPWTLLRTPGLAADTVEPLGDDAALDTVTALVEDRDRAALAEEFEHRHLPAAVEAAADRSDRTRLSRARRTVGRGEELAGAQLDTWNRCGEPSWAARWADATRADRARRAAAVAAHDTAVAAAREHAAHRCARPDVAHAVFLSSRDFHDNAFSRYARTDRAVRDDTRARQAYATMARYLRRLSVRCELTSFFGPTHFVRLDPDLPDAVVPGEQGNERVHVEPSVWLISELHRRAVRRVPVGARRLRRTPTVSVVDGRLRRLLDGTDLDVSPPALGLWHALDGDRTVDEACAAAGVDAGRAVALLRELGPAVVVQAELPAHDLWPFEAVLEVDAPDGPAHRVARLRDEFARTAWPGRAEAFTATERLVADLGVAERRGRGEHYADRYVLHEERTHPSSARTALGGPAVRGLLDSMADVLPLCQLAALLDRADARDAVRAVLGGSPAPLLDLLRADPPPVGGRGDALRARLRDLVAARCSDDPGGEAVLTRADVDGLVSAFAGDLEADGDDAALAGPDMMVLGDPGTAPWLLGELHDDGSYLAGGVTRLHPDGEAVRRELLGAVATVLDPGSMAAVVSRRRNMFLVPEMPGISIELSGLSGKPRGRTVPISDVTVAPDATGVLVGGRRYRLYTGDIPSVVHRALAVPSLTPVAVDCGERTPRVRIGRTVVQRARWRVTLPAGGTGFDGWERAHALRRRLGLPRRVFVRHPREQKPLFVDFADPLAVDDLVRLPEAEVIVSEMLPGPADLWWRDPGTGAAQCAELRTACLVALRADG